MAFTRLLSTDDAPALAEVLSGNRGFLAPWEPVRGDDFFGVEGQLDIVRRDLREYAEGRMLPLAIVAGGGLVGRINVNGITRGAFQSASIGYWVGASHSGRGIATGAVAETKERAFAGLGLHRLQAETLIGNTASRVVLERNGFTPFGIAPKFLRIAGRWQDHILYQALNPEED
ncbi:ribosomal-protein-alanine N-acetyltransferase [Nocardiopsis mwathae]|uniref:Ribosomal-protein-alanine N-acetyltransferase n=1 Tax=Nocardiopsis mwathae TaxID=1472723 RepID=A0A7W9YMV2_9ACTN|nr:GNAT family protein [Nocardiopsis mwathae]MBB6174899.1 ribosomal-protein-alanine N-acetyltransferase [Nocardiopsis mwathae]